MANQRAEKNGKPDTSGKNTKFPKHSIEKALRIPRAILEQNAGKVCSDREAANFVGVKYNKGPYSYELGNAIKYGLLARPTASQVALTETAKKILRPQKPEQLLEGLREAVLKPADFSKVYSHYRGENLPDEQFLHTPLRRRKIGSPVEFEVPQAVGVSKET
jgi:hypothetical protein